MHILNGHSEAVCRLMKVLNLPANTAAFTLKVRAGEFAVLEVETLIVKDGGIEAFITELKQYELHEIEAPKSEKGA